MLDLYIEADIDWLLRDSQPHCVQIGGNQQAQQRGGKRMAQAHAVLSSEDAGIFSKTLLGALLNSIADAVSELQTGQSKAGMFSSKSIFKWIGRFFFQIRVTSFETQAHVYSALFIITEITGQPAEMEVSQGVG